MGIQRKRVVVPVWWVLGECSEVSCVDEKKRNKVVKKVALCQICRLCKAHCIGHRGILDGLRPVLTVHSYA